MTVGQLHRILCDFIATKSVDVNAPIHIENHEDDSQVLGVIADDHDPWDELGEAPERYRCVKRSCARVYEKRPGSCFDCGSDIRVERGERPVRLIITATDGHRWASSAAGRKANSSARRAQLRDRKTAIKLIVAHVLASTAEPAASFREVEKHVEELIGRYIAEKPE